MALTETQWTELYKTTIDNRADIRWIREELADNNLEIKDCEGRIVELEKARSFSKGTVAYLSATITVVFTVAANILLWFLGYFGGTK